MKIPRDKLLHAAAGLGLSLGVGLLLWPVLGFSLALAVAFCASVVLGVAKEIHDAQHPQQHTAEAADAWATILGGLAGILLAAACMLLLSGCGGGKPATQRSKQPVPETPAAPARPAPESAAAWRQEAQILRNERDRLQRQVAAADQAIASADQRAIEADTAAQATWGRRIAALVFAAAVVVTILSFLPWGAIIPKWIGPAGILASIAILAAARAWVWVQLHLGHLMLGLLGLGLLVAVYLAHKLRLLDRIRSNFTAAIETADTDADVLLAKAAAIEEEIRVGVHGLGQRLRGKQPKTRADAARLRALATSGPITPPRVVDP